MGFLETLGIIFIVLKLIGVIGWSWWWVVSPICIGLLITALFVSLIIHKSRKAWKEF